MTSLSALIDATQTDPSDWTYISEGGATIVFSYSGPSRPLFECTVLRLRKIKKSAAATGSSAAEVLSTGPDDPSVEFQARVTSKLIPSEYLPRLENAYVHEPWLTKLAELQDSKRPEARRSVDGINVKSYRCVLATDLIGRDGWAVEIKPKWAFMPNPHHLSPTTTQAKLTRCRFCLHTHYRSVHEPDAPAGRTKYCPLDLFRNSENGINHALRALWESWMESNGSINNLKIFAGGSIVLPNDTNRVKALANALNMPPDLSSDSSQVYIWLSKHISRALLQTRLLSHLQFLQRMLDPLDIEGLAKLWEQQHPGKPLGSGCSEPTVEEWDSFVEEYLGEKDRDLQAEWKNPLTSRLRYYMMAYLLSATFKDCSIILRFSPEAPVPTISVIDLDPKPMSRLKKWQDLDMEIAKCFTESGDVHAAGCIDGVGWEW